MLATLSYNCHFCLLGAPLPARTAILNTDVFRPPNLASESATPHEDRVLQVRHSQLELLFSWASMFGVQTWFLSNLKNTSYARYLRCFVAPPVFNHFCVMLKRAPRLDETDTFDFPWIAWFMDIS